MNTADTKTCFLALGIEPKTGGTYKSLKLFQEALGGPILAFTTSRQTGERSPDGSIEYLGNRTLHYLPQKLRVYALERARSAKLLSCHVVFRYHTTATRELSQKLKIPYWAVPHGSLDPWVFERSRRVKEAWYRLFGKRFLREAAHVVCATQRECDKLRERHDADNLRVVHWPVEPLEIASRAEARASLRRKLGLPTGARILLFFGRYHSMKRPLETIEYFKMANTSEQVHLVLAGIDYDVPRAQLEALASDHPRIKVLPAVYGDERQQLLLGSDAYISLSYRENFNHSAAEAMSAGQAVILSPGNDLRYSFPNAGDFGWFPNEVSPDAVMAAIEALDRTNESCLLQKGEAAARWVRAELSFEKFSSALRKLHAEATGQLS
ncbi:MAG: glycosyltransferase [Opitutales bacterium]